MASGCHEKAKSLTWCSNLTFCFSSAEKILLIYMVSQVIFFTPKYDFFFFCCLVPLIRQMQCRVLQPTKNSPMQWGLSRVDIREDHWLSILMDNRLALITYLKEYWVMEIKAEAFPSRSHQSYSLATCKVFQRNPELNMRTIFMGNYF